MPSNIRFATNGVFAVKYNESTYFYRKNAQNDIIALLDSNDSVMVKYKYDAWGYTKKEINPSAIWGAAFGALFALVGGSSPSASSLAKVAGRSLEQQLVKILKYKVIKRIIPLLLENLLNDFTSWYTSEAINHFYNKNFNKELYA
jgi:hypothetical protein